MKYKKFNDDILIIHDKREKVTSKMADNSVDLVASDPPFGVRDDAWDNKEHFINMVCHWLDEDLRISKYGVVWFGAGKMLPYILTKLIKENRYEEFKRQHNWEKPEGSQFNGASNNNIWYSNEYIWVFSRNWDELKKFGKDMPFGYDAFKYRTIAKVITGHPTSKPVPLMRKLIGHYSAPGHLIFDGFGGSFSTAIACIDMGRRFLGVEQSPLPDRPITDINGDNPDYFGNGTKRIQKHLDEPKLFTGVSDGDSEDYEETLNLFEKTKGDEHTTH